jgi:hypothetical protein
MVDVPAEVAGDGAAERRLADPLTGRYHGSEIVMFIMSLKLDQF